MQPDIHCYYWLHLSCCVLRWRWEALGWPLREAYCFCEVFLFVLQMLVSVPEAIAIGLSLP